MFVKKFEATSMEQALAMVKNEMGPNALILSTTQRKGKWFGKQMVEVTAAQEKRASKPADDTFDEAELLQIFPHRKVDRSQAALRAFQEKEKPPPPPPSRRTSAEVYRTSTQPKAVKRDSDPERFMGGFTRLGLTSDSARELSRRMAFDYPAKDLLHPGFVEKMRAKLVAAAVRTLGPETFQERTSWTAIGLPGSGKTSLLVKLALALKGKKMHVSLVGCDKRKVTARQELSSYARLIQVPFKSDAVVPKELKELQLIDSPSYCPGDEESGRRLEAICQDRKCFVVLDAGQRLSELLRVVENTRRYRPVGVAFTRLDTVAEHGVIFDLLKATKLPLVGVSLSASFATPFRFFEPIELAHFILNQAPAAFLDARNQSEEELV